MEFNINELGATLAIGAYLLFSMKVLILSFLKINIFDELVAKAKVGELTIKALVVVACFIIGMLAEDVSNKFVDGNIWIHKYNILPEENELRTSVLLDDTGLKLSKLGIQLVEQNMLVKNITNDEMRSGKYEPIGYKERNDQLLSKQIDYLNKVAIKLYYQAKNNVYLKNNYYKELSKIQLRIDFSRSFSLISFFLFAVCLILASWVLMLSKHKHKIINICIYIMHKLKLQSNSKSGIISVGSSAVHANNTRVIQIVLITLMFLALFFFGRTAYTSEEIEFNKRTFGYYATLLYPESGTNDQSEEEYSIYSISGIAAVKGHNDTYLVVHDEKNPSSSPRLAVAKGTYNRGYIYEH